MLPEVTLRNVSRDDVDRVAWWLEVEEISSKWFGHYACGDPVHRGYDPGHMLEAAEREWRSVFANPQRRIFSIYDKEEDHIGECQVVFDERGGAELSVLIGRKDLWHRGLGTATVMTLLERTFEQYGLDRAWVNIPEDNAPALGLFQKLGFVSEATRELCRRPDGTALNARIMAMDARSYGALTQDNAVSQESAPVVTITGLPGSGSQSVAKQVAAILGGRFVEDEIREGLGRRLRCSPGELEALEATERSFWGRMLNVMVLPADRSATYDFRYHWLSADYHSDHDDSDDQITKKRYVECLSAVVRSIAAEGNVVLHGQGSHLFAPPSSTTLNVFVAASEGSRRRMIWGEQGLSPDDAARRLKRLDRDEVSTCKNLMDGDLLDVAQYALTVNLDRMTQERAAELVVGALGIAVPATRTRRPTRITAPALTM